MVEVKIPKNNNNNSNNTGSFYINSKLTKLIGDGEVKTK